jgi:hypothetical protein
MRSNHKLMRTLAERTRLSPTKREAEIRRLVDRILNSSDSKRTMQSLPLHIAAEATPIKARVVGPFVVEFARSEVRTAKCYPCYKCCQVELADNKIFALQSRGGGFIVPAGAPAKPEIRRWTVVYDERFTDKGRDLTGFMLEVSARQVRVCFVNFLRWCQGAVFGQPATVVVTQRRDHAARVKLA